MAELKLNKRETASEHNTLFEIDKLEKSIVDIEHNITDINEEFHLQMKDLAKERNYEPWFKVALITGIVWFIYKHSFSSFFLFLILLACFLIYKKFFHKEKRVLELKEDLKVKLQPKEAILAQQKKEVAKLLKSY